MVDRQRKAKGGGHRSIGGGRHKMNEGMEDVIKRSGNAFGTNEAIILSQLALAAIPAAAVIFLDVITSELPQICVVSNYSGSCVPYRGNPAGICYHNITWRYTSTPDYSIVVAYDMLCDPPWTLTMIRFMFFLGMLLGCSMAGVTSDYFGRKPTLMIFLFFEGLFVGLLIIARTYYVWILLRFLNGVSIGYFVVSKVILVEGLKIRYRSGFLAAIWTAFGAGVIFLGVLDYLFDRYSDKIAILVILIYILWGVYLFGIEESLRWLLVKRKKERAIYLLNKISYRNKVDLPTYEEIPKPKDDELDFIDTFKTPKSRYLIMILVALSILGFFLLVSYTADFGYYLNDIYSVALNLIIVGSLHIAGVAVAAVSSHFWGRRPTISSLHILALVSLIILIAFMHYANVVIVCGWSIRLISGGLVYFSSLYSLEVFPTPFRAKAVGLIASGSAVGGVISTGSDLIASKDSEFIITIIEIIAVFLITILTFGLRETKGRPLPEYVETMPQVLPWEEWCSCIPDNPENHPLLDSPLFSHIHANRLPSTIQNTPLGFGQSVDEDEDDEGETQSTASQQQIVTRVLHQANEMSPEQPITQRAKSA